MIQLGLFFDEPDETAPSSRREALEHPPRGFAALERERHRDISSKGGRAAARSGKAHRFSPSEARLAGRKGGRARWGLRVKAPAKKKRPPRQVYLVIDGGDIIAGATRKKDLKHFNDEIVVGPYVLAERAGQR